MFSSFRTGATAVVMWAIALVLAVLADPLTNAFRRAMRATDTNGPLPRLVRFAQHAFQKHSYGRTVAGGRGFAIRAATVALVLLGLALTGPMTALVLAFPGETATDDKEKQLDAILEEAQKLQDKYSGRAWGYTVDEKGNKKADPQGVRDRTRFEMLCKEGDELQKDIAAENEFKRMTERGRNLREVPEPTLPNPRNHLDGKGNGRAVAGYISLGDAVIASEAFRKFASENYATGTKAVVQVIGAIIGKNVMRGPSGEPLVPLTRDQRKVFEEVLNSREMKAVPTLGTGVIEPDRLARVPQAYPDERLSIRDVISTGQTSSSSVEYVRDITPVPDLLTPQTPGQPKPELAAQWELTSTNVRTIAGWMPVQNQQLEDWAQLRSLIDGRLRYAVKRTEEYEVMYGDNTGQHLQGILNVSGVQNIAINGRYDVAQHTLIDVVRMGITDIMVAGYQANAVVMHPYEWETIVLEKGTDDRYVWAVVTDQNGSRIWGLRAVETVGAQNRATNARNLVVGDWQMGAQLLDRMDLTVQVGLVDDQFVRNMRTILAEERIALAVYAPAAFATFEVEAGS